jgi:energy-coupling factor transporter transmembrane protein EcfT
LPLATKCASQRRHSEAPTVSDRYIKNRTAINQVRPLTLAAFVFAVTALASLLAKVTNFDFFALLFFFLFGLLFGLCQTLNNN